MTYTAMTPLARLRADAARLREVWHEAELRAELEQQAEERAAAVADAHRYVQDRFPGTLAPLLPDADAWAGYPAVFDKTPHRAPCAVTFLGEGVFLLFEQAATDDQWGVCSLVALHQCLCGNVLSHQIPDEYELVDNIADRLAPAVCWCLNPGANEGTTRAA